MIADGRSARLLWVQSPRLHVDNKQWRTIATFAEEDTNGFSQIELPWGALPALRLGQWFEDGMVSGLRSPVGQRYELEVPPQTPMTIRKAREVVPFDVNQMLCRENGEENCFVFALRHCTVVLPVIECVRAILAPCKFLAYGLLEPDYFRRIITLNHLEAEQKRLRLDFAAEIARKSLTPPVVAHIARLLYDHSFCEAWGYVQTNRIADAGLCDAPAHCPLAFRLPALAPTWTVRASPCENDVLVILEILHVQPANSLPFKNVSFTHPKSVKKRKQKRPKVTEKESDGTMVKDHKSLALNASPKPPKQSREPHLIKIQPLAVLSLSSLGVHEIVQPLPSDSNPAVEQKQIIQRKDASAPGDAKVSLSDQGGGGDDPAAEFSPEQDEPIACLPGQGLQEFARVVICLRDLYPNVSVKWLLRPLVGRRTAFTVIGKQPRMYAAVRLQWLKTNPGAICWLLEVGRSNRFTLSTFVFRLARNGSKQASEAAIEDLLGDFLDGNGWWKRNELPKIIGGALRDGRLVQHLNRRTETRARRLYKEAVNMAGSRV